MSVEPAPGGLRALGLRLGAVAGAVVLGLVLQRAVAARLEAIDALSRTDLLAARAQLATLFEIASVAVFGSTAAVGASIVLACRRGLAAAQFPPPGVWSWGSSRVLTGPRACVAARVGLALGAALVIASLAGGGLGWYMAAVLRACRAT